MDGLEAARRIRSECNAREQPRLIALTANRSRGPTDVPGCSMDDYLTKPMGLDQLQAALLRAIR
jgi:CheY-like chemotaxis protein